MKTIYERLKEHPQKLEEIYDIEQLVVEFRAALAERPINRDKYHVLAVNMKFFADLYLETLLDHIDKLEGEMLGYN